MPSTHNQNIGQKGENIAARFLISKGHQIILKNFRIWHDEIDIIAKKDDVLIFVEVKTRTTAFGSAEEAVYGFKQRKLMRAVQKYLSGHGLDNAKFRIDLIVIELDRSFKKAKVKHYEEII